MADDGQPRLRARAVNREDSGLSAEDESATSRVGESKLEHKYDSPRGTQRSRQPVVTHALGSRAFDSLLGTFFPAAKDLRTSQSHFRVTSSRRIMSSPSFQAILYFNFWFSVVMVALSILMMIHKLEVTDPADVPYRSLKLRFVGGACGSAPQGTCTDVSAPSASDVVTVVVSKGSDAQGSAANTYFHGSVSSNNAEVSVNPLAVGDQALDLSLTARVFSREGALAQFSTFSTNCDESIAVGDRFGALQVSELIAPTEPSCKQTKSGSQIFTRFVSPAVYTLWSLVEFYRLYLGYVGNLQERVPQLAAFLFVTVFPQLFFTVYMFVQTPKIYLERVLASVYVGYIVLGLIFGYRTTSSIIENKTARFAVEFGDENPSERERLVGDQSMGRSSSVQSSRAPTVEMGVI